MTDPIPAFTGMTNPEEDMFLVDEQLEQKQKIIHRFYGRRGGVSYGIYDSLNCGVGSGDDGDAVDENRRRVMKLVDSAPEQLLTLRQVHSPDCLVVTDIWEADEMPEADAMATDKPDIALGILTADCAPVLFYGEREDGSPVIGAAHAGWRGAKGGVLAETVGKMIDIGADLTSIAASVGPCLRQESYEVDEGFYKSFIDDSQNNEIFFGDGRENGKYRFDLPGYIVNELSGCGIKNISSLPVDTYFNEEDFFSYRRGFHRNEPDYGRQVSLIMIKSS